MSTFSSSFRRPPADRISDGLLQQIIGALSHDRGTGLVIALTSVNPGAGVGYSASTLAQELGDDNSGSVLCLDSRTLDELHRDAAMLHPAILAGLVPGPSRPGEPAPWRDGYSFRKAVLGRLRSRYQYILVSCPSLLESSDILSISAMVDGIILVVEANRTQTRQIAVVERTIVAARGHILGHILNKRAYFIPKWVYAQLSKFGI